MDGTPLNFVNGKSTFEFDDYEYIRNPGKGSAPEVVLERGECPGVPTIGVKWLEDKLNAQVYCPLTSILAVKIKGEMQ
jgi:hypothetical protein